MRKSSSSFLFPDVNVWLALSYARHVHHSVAREWFESLNSNIRLCFCRFTQLGLLRLLATDAVMGSDGALTQTGAWRTYDRWLEDGRVVLLAEPATLEERFRSLSQSGRPAPKEWADSYLAAFAIVAGLRLVTFDRRLQYKSDNILLLGP